MKKIAFCFLIYDIINHEELWNIFFKNIDTNKYNITTNTTGDNSNNPSNAEKKLDYSMITNGF